jgi:hypothetical protein
MWRQSTDTASPLRWVGLRTRRRARRSRRTDAKLGSWIFRTCPIALTSSSTDRVETPWIYASWITATSAFSAVRRGSRKPGKYVPRRSLGIRRSIDPARVSPQAIAVAIAAVDPLAGALAVHRPGALLDLEVYEARDDLGQELADDVVLSLLLNELGQCDTSTAIVVSFR